MNQIKADEPQFILDILYFIEYCWGLRLPLLKEKGVNLLGKYSNPKCTLPNQRAATCVNQT